MNISLLSNSMFGIKHIIILVLCVLILVALSIFLKNIKLKNAYKILLITGIISESIKIIYYILTNENSVATYIYNESTGLYEAVTYSGYLPKTDLPFHLCSIQLIFILILNLSKNDNLKKLLMSFMLPTCLIGGIAAILIPTSSSLNGSFILSIQYFGYHVVIAWFSILLFMTKEIEFTIKDYRNALFMLFGTFFLAIYLNSMVADYVHDVNFMYVVNPPQKGLPFLNKDHGWGVYIAHYACLALFCLTLCYIKPIINSIKNKLNKERVIN